MMWMFIYIHMDMDMDMDMDGWIHDITIPMHNIHTRSFRYSKSHLHLDLHLHIHIQIQIHIYISIHNRHLYHQLMQHPPTFTSNQANPASTPKPKPIKIQYYTEQCIDIS